MARLNHTATLLADGRVLIAGGESTSPGAANGITAEAEIYTPKTGTFAATGSMTAPRTRQTATRLASGVVLIAGGRGDAENPAWAELFSPATGTFIRTGSMSTWRDGMTATLLRDGLVLVTGGWGDAGLLATAELYNPKTGTFDPTGQMATPRTGAAAALLSGGLVLVVGGEWSGVPAELYLP
jgi:hypothetical protein